MNNGFIYPFFDNLIEILKWLNIIEPIKAIVWKLSKEQNQAKRNCNIAIDLFILFKFLIIIIFLSQSINNLFSLYFTQYLIASNIFVYFYYHIWKIKISNSEHQKRRFLNLVISIFFMVLAYAYLYDIPFHSEFSWNIKNTDEFFQAMRFSIANSFTLSAEITATTEVGKELVLSQQVLSFSFIVIILSQSIPNKDS